MSLKTFGKALVRRKYLSNTNITDTKLDRCLTTIDLTFLGVGSTLGLGIYVLAGQVASIKAGPAVAVSFLVAAVASVFAALCYAEFGARVPKAGSAYVYSYVTVGEFMAFVIGWNLILEYVIGTASVARGYSGYLDSLLNGTIQHTLTKYLPMHVTGLSAYPDFLSLGITLLLTGLLAFGVKESTGFNNVFTCLNLLVVLYAVITGLFKVNLHNWEIPPEQVPTNFGKGGFFPYGFSGMMAGASMCFYGYVGFDCIATTGEEAKNPQKSIPISIMLSLFIVFLSYFGISMVQTLMWPYYDQNQQAPLPYVFDRVGWPTARWIISIGALAGLSTSLLGSMFPLPRVLSSMANDGLIFRWLGEIHSKYKTPFLATIICGVFSGLMAMMFDVNELAAMMSIGTLLAYTLVAASVLILRYRILDERVMLGPLLNCSPSAPTVPLTQSDLQTNSIMTETSSIDSTIYNCGVTSPSDIYFGHANFNSHDVSTTASLNTLLTSTRHYTASNVLKMVLNVDNNDIQTAFSSTASVVLIGTITFLIIILDFLLIFLEDELFHGEVLTLCGVCFMIMLIVVFSIVLSRQPSDRKELLFRVPYVPLFPILSIFVNIYLMMKLSFTTWIRFGVWMFIGLTIYFAYGMNHSSENVYSFRPVPCNIETTTDVEESDIRKAEDLRKTENSPLLGCG